MAAATDCGFEIFLIPHILRTWHFLPVSETENQALW
jgi:hypothetical protein